MEHNLIPLALFTLNLSLCHLIYLLYITQAANYIFLPAVAVCTLILAAGVIRKNKYLLMPANAGYLLLLLADLRY